MPTTAVLAAFTMPYENFMNELARCIAVQRMGLPTIMCAFEIKSEERMNPHKTSRLMHGMPGQK